MKVSMVEWNLQMLSNLETMFSNQPLKRDTGENTLHESLPREKIESSAKNIIMKRCHLKSILNWA